MHQSERRSKLVDVARQIQTEQTGDGVVARVEPGPAQRERRTGRRDEVADDRTVRGDADTQRDVGLSLHPDDLGDDVERLGTARRHDLPAGDLLDEQILHVGPRVGDAPRHLPVVSRHDGRNAGERGADDIELPAGEVSQIPVARDLRVEVWIVGEHRLASRRARAGEHPVVAADLLPAEAQLLSERAMQGQQGVGLIHAWSCRRRLGQHVCGAIEAALAARTEARLVRKDQGSRP